MVYWRFIFANIFLFQLFLITSQACAQSASSQAKTSNRVVNTELSLKLNEEGISAVKSENFDQAEDLFKKSLSADSGNITAAFNLAGMFLNNQRTNEAIDLLKKYIKTYPKDAGLYVRLGDCYFSEKKLDLALLNYERALAIDSKYPRLSSKLGTVYGLMSRTLEAEKMYRIAVKANPRDVAALENLSVLLLSNGKAKEALQVIKNALELNSSESLYNLLGQAYQLLKDPDNAAIAFGRAKSLGK